MAESTETVSPSSQDASPTVGVGQPEGSQASAAVEQLLTLRRLGIVMSPDAARSEEAMGVLNPASARSREGDLYLFPRVVADGNYSRIGIGAVRFDDAGNPVGVERLGIVLEPQERYEIVEPGVGGVEDPRITYIPLLGCYVMTYTALGPAGARIALAVSDDLRHWDRLGPLWFEIDGDVDLNRCDNKDCVIFPLPLASPDGHSSLALLHRPIYLVPGPDGSTEWLLPPGVTDRRPSIWISYVPVDQVKKDLKNLTTVGNHQLLAQPIGRWEHHHIGAGAPPILSEEGWLLYYHGVIGAPAGLHAPPGGLVYQSGVMLLDRDDPRRVLYRSSRPVLLPEERGEQEGIVDNVVFPTAVDVRGQRVDVYYGAADARIAAATTQISASVLMAPSAPPGVEADGWSGGPGAGANEVSRPGRQERVGETGMQVKDIMTTTVEVVTPDTTLAEAADRMRTVDVGVLPVQEDGQIVGVVTDRDMTVRAIAHGLDARTATVAAVMTRQVHSCYEDESLEEAADKMVDGQARRLVVLDHAQRLVGVVSLDDLATGAGNPALAGETLQRMSLRPDRARGRYDRILVALDGSRLAERVFPSIEPLAQKFNSTVILLRAVPASDVSGETPATAGAQSSGGQATITIPVKTVHQEATAYLTGIKQRLEATGLSVKTECPEGSASAVILHRALELDVDLIALTTHGRTGLDRLLLGSVAEDVIRQAPCPVHLVRVLSSH